MGAFRKLKNDDRGAALVEFGISLPFVLILFAVIVDGSRMLWSYQAASAGVRDAARYLARVAPRDICASGGSVVGYSTQLTGIVANSSTGTAIFPSSITVNSVTPGLACVSGAYRNGEASIAQVSANVSITMPFAPVFTLIGSTVPSVTTTITDSSRIYGS